MSAIIRRELRAYFTSPIGYIFLVGFYIVAGVFFYLTNLASATADMSNLYGLLFTVTLVLLPLLTMRLMSEEKKLKTDQLLLTAPVSLGAQVFAKFIAAFAMYLLALSVTLVYGLVLTAYTSPGWAMILGNFLGLLMVGGAIISIGLFISTLTESQIVAAIGTYGVVSVVLLIDAVGSIITSAFVKRIIYSISFYNRYIEFTQGLFNLEHVIFFISFFAVFIFLTVRLLEKRRWN